MRESIIVDTREKRPWTFERFGAVSRRGTLKSGDYSLEGFQGSGIAIERKSFTDLYGSMTAGRLRFYAELGRLGEFGLAALIVEADEEMVLRGSGRTCVNPGRMLKTLYAWCCAFKIQVHFCANAYEAEAKAYRLMLGWRDARELKRI
jgi:ERCC4-type nuclease